MRRAFLLLLAFAAPSLAVVTEAGAQMTVVSSWAVSDPTDNQTYFSVTFSTVPDFMSVDGFGRQADSFQYYITYAAPYTLQNFSILIRGDEIHYASTIVIRDRSGVPDPHSGGWGPKRGEVPYTLSGKTLTFSCPSSMIGDQDGFFRYEIATYRYGALVPSSHYGFSSVGPTPTLPSTWGRVKRLYR